MLEVTRQLWDSARRRPAGARRCNTAPNSNPATLAGWLALALLVFFAPSPASEESSWPDSSARADFTREGPRYRDFTYWENMEAYPVEAAPSQTASAETGQPSGPSADLNLTLHRPAGDTVEWYFGCSFGIEDDNANYWHFTYVARLYDPVNTQIAYHTSWAYKPSFSSSLGTSVGDPLTGTYRCEIDWWVEDYYIGQRQGTATISYGVPTGETTIENAWSGLIPTAYKWRGRVEGGNFGGRQVREAEGGNDVDTCWWPQSAYAPATGLSGGTWDVDGNSEYGDDTVGWHWQMVDYYRSQGRAPCQSETDQAMEINRPGTSWAPYKTNRLKMGFTATTVWSERDGHAVSKSY